MVSTLQNLQAGDATDTILLGRNARLRRQNAETATEADDTLREKRVTLRIRGMSEEVSLVEGASLIIGRSNPSVGYYPDIDLTPYGAHLKGVSRSHARLYLHHNHLYITDMCSDNGTFSAGECLVPDKPHQLRRGDEIVLGGLPIQVYFE